MMGGISTVPGVLLRAAAGRHPKRLGLSGISPFWQLAVQGFLILLAVADSTIQQRIKRTMMRGVVK
jgi:ribose/xylose/arabinose/galactoside ABC-type transport system permease subunit